jgi:uncharacterized protein YjbI with pentapeptide repeats
MLQVAIALVYDWKRSLKFLISLRDTSTPKPKQPASQALFSVKKMKLKPYSLATLFLSVCLTAPALAANPDHVRQLQTTNTCRRCDLSGTDLKNANLVGADLLGANLVGANLENANLSEANLSSSNLAGVNFRSTNLSRANLTGANLVEANLSNTNLSEADLKYTNLVNVNLDGTKLSGADLSAANLAGVDLSTADLTGAKVLGANLVGALGLSLPLLPMNPTLGSDSEPTTGESSPNPVGSPSRRGGTRGGREYQPPTDIGRPTRTEGAGTYQTTPPTGKPE